MHRTHTPRTRATTYHRDGTVTVWDRIAQQWVRGSDPSNALLATLDAAERERIAGHIGGETTKAGSEGRTEVVSFRVSPDTAAKLDELEGGRHVAARWIVLKALS